MLPALLLAQRRAMQATRFVSSNMHAALVKSDTSPVTAADFASQAVLSLTLSEDDAARGIPILGEEDADSLARPENAELRKLVRSAVAFAFERDSMREHDVLNAIQDAHSPYATSEARFFTLDPVDGTKGFLRGGQYAIALALIEDGTPVLAALGCPHLPPFSLDATMHSIHVDAVGTLQYAERAWGAFEVDLRDPTGSPRAIRAREWKSGSTIRVAESVEAAHSAHDECAKALALLSCPISSLRLDSQAKYALVARGDADLYIRMPTRAGYFECIWDHAAGVLIAQEAGARACDLNGNALDFSAGERLFNNLGVLCGDEELITQLLAALRR